MERWCRAGEVVAYRLGDPDDTAREDLEQLARGRGQWRVLLVEVYPGAPFLPRFATAAERGGRAARRRERRPSPTRASSPRRAQRTGKALSK
jgi:hypothetical protein